MQKGFFKIRTLYDTILSHIRKKWEYFLNSTQWDIFCKFRSDFKQKVIEWNNRIPQLSMLEKKAAVAAGTPDYPFENAVVYNTDLDKITKEDDIKLIVIGDNPGKDEQLSKNQRYLCGQAGKIADGFFKKHPELGIDFRRNVIILNKTPVHSAKTAQLKTIIKLGGQSAADLLLESQLWMAEHTARLHQQLADVELWLVGYSELKEKHFFYPYKDELKKAYSLLKPEAMLDSWDKVFVFQHFSMNRFTIDLANYDKDDLPLAEKLKTVGMLHKKEIFGN